MAEGAAGTGCGKVWISSLVVSRTHAHPGTMAYQVRVFQSCRSPVLLPTTILLRYVAGCRTVVAIKSLWNAIWFWSSIALAHRHERAYKPWCKSHTSSLGVPDQQSSPILLQDHQIFAQQDHRPQTRPIWRDKFANFLSSEILDDSLSSGCVDFCTGL